MAKFNVTGEQDLGIDKQMFEIKRQIRQKGGSPIDPELVALVLQDIVEGKFIGRKAKQAKLILRLLKGESPFIDAVNGEETLAQAKDVFSSGIDLDFKKWGTDQPGIATEETPVQVYEMAQDATFAQIFSSLGDLDKLCLTQHQIKNFCKKHPDCLRSDGFVTFGFVTCFLFKVGNKYFVAHVSGLYIYVYRLKDGTVWKAETPHCVVVPQRVI